MNMSLVKPGASRPADALASCQRNLTLHPESPDAHLQCAAVLRSLGKSEEAIHHCNVALKLDPLSALAHFHLGDIQMARGSFAEALGAYRACVDLDPGLAVAHQRLGWIAFKHGEFLDALECYQHALAAGADTSVLHLDIGMALMALERFDEAQASIDRAIALKPLDPELYFHLARCLRRKNLPDDATASLEKAVQVGRGSGPLRLKAASAVGRLGRNDVARRLLLPIAPNDPAYAHAQSGLGTMAFTEGRHDEAIRYFKTALRLIPGLVGTRSSLLLALNYAAGYSAQSIFQEHVEFGRAHARGLKGKWVRPGAGLAGKRLRVGYVSGDFKEHSVAYFVETALSCHDHDSFELYGYSNTPADDGVTRSLKTHFDHWHNIRTLSDEHAAALIRQHDIDILVDLSGHTADNRLLVFARKPAPIQVSWLGYPNTTGLDAMDYRLTDGFAEPVGMTERYNVEKLWRLPDVFCCYSPCVKEPARRASAELAVRTTPALKNGYVTFGNFNNIAKMSPSVVALWARLLRELPSAKLMLEAPRLGTDYLRERVLAQFAAHGVGEQQLILLGRKPEQQYVLYHEVDIALDSFPCNGGTTSFDTLWMGVPLVTLAGQTFVSRMGVSLLSNLGLTELVAQNEDQYCEIVKRLTADALHLDALRQSIRPRMEASPLLDQARFTRNMESAFRAMWAGWCTGKP